MNSINWTVLVMNDWEEIFVEHTKEEINTAIDQAIAVKRNYITITHLDRDIYFNYIKDKKNKVRYLAIEAPQKEYKEPTQQEREDFEKFQKDFKIRTYETRKKNFRIKRDKILHDLQKEEKEFWLESVLNKLTDLDKRRLQEQKESLDINK